MTQTKDGRTILRGAEYTKFRVELYHYQAGHCFRCDRYTSLTVPIDYDNSFHVHHKNGRGMGGGRRDDILSAVEGLCGRCHREEHSQCRTALG